MEPYSREPQLNFLAPLHLHPTDVGGMCIGPETAWQKWGMPQENGAAWDFVWANGNGRRPWEHGTIEAFALVCELAIRFETVNIGPARYWVPRSAVEGEYDLLDDEEWVDVEPSDERREWVAWAAAHPDQAHIRAREVGVAREPEPEPELRAQEVNDRVLAGALHEIAECWKWKHGGLEQPLLLVPMDVHPCDLGDGMEECAAWAEEDLALDYGNAWDQLWMNGEGRRVCYGGHERYCERVRKVAGVQFVPVTVGGRQVWLPRATDPDVWWDDEPAAEQAEPRDRVQEKDVGFELLIDGRPASAEELAELECIEGRGWPMWMSDNHRTPITVGDA